MVFMPPRHGKSELVSRRLPAFLLGLSPANRIIIGSYADDLASSFNADVEAIMKTDEYKTLFPETCLEGLRRHDYKETNGGGYVLTRGIKGGVSGRGLTFGIVDDPVKGQKEADSPVDRDGVWDWYTSNFLTRRDNWDAGILVTQTRWHRDDLSGRLLAQMANASGDQWETICFPAIRGVEANALDPRAEGEALWPWRMPVEELGRIKSIDRRTFAALYQQDPTADGGAEWGDECFGDGIWEDKLPTTTMRFVSLDPSKGKGSKHGDYSAIVGVGFGVNNLIHVGASIERRSPSQMLEDLFTFCDEFKPDFVGCETNQFQELLVGELVRLANEPSRSGTHLAKMIRMGQPIVQFDNRVNKELRIRRLSQYITRREFRYIKSSSTRILVEQLKDFPNGEHDDGPDALEMALRIPYVVSNTPIPDASNPDRISGMQ